MNHYRIETNGRCLEFGHQTAVMGILNITPDSFSDGGRFFSYEVAVAQGTKMAAEGADIIDIGGESTRPFSEMISEAEEIRRVVPVVEALAKTIDVPISVDTMKAEVARRSLDAGAAIINDISALRHDPDMAGLVAETGVPVILMHMLGSPKTMQVNPIYENVVEDIIRFLEEAMASAERQGVDRGRIIIDPGLGFGKTMAHNLTLLQQVPRFASLDAPILIGASRKKFIRTLLRSPDREEPSPQSPEVAVGSLAAVAAAVLGGAHIVRVHDVAETRATVAVTDAIRNAQGHSDRKQG
ncbi:MAG: dihydropteroate synthase [Desulfobacterales bacterium]|jgi:dihydropteroate synthase